jgi:hypothetical protein
MPVPSNAHARIRKLLDEDDEIRYVFPANVLLSAKPSVLVVVSSKAIKVLSTGFFSRKYPKSVEAEFPRRTRLGPVDTQQTPFFVLSGLEYEIDEEYIAVVNAIDSDLFAENSPLDPHPDL